MNKQPIIRIEKISISNYKNINNAVVNLTENLDSASIFGLYGQNGSGKTALIESVALLKLLLCGDNLPLSYGESINIDSTIATFKYQIRIKNNDSDLRVFYEVSITKENELYENKSFNNKTEYKTRVLNEILSFVDLLDVNANKTKLIDTRNSDTFTPSIKRKELIGITKDNLNNAIVYKKISEQTSTSFIFSRQMFNMYRNNSTNNLYLYILNELNTYANISLFIINTDNMGIIANNQIPLYFKIKDEDYIKYGHVIMNINGSVPIKEEYLETIKKVFENMNIVLKQIIPGLTIDVQDLGPDILEDGTSGRAIKLLSNRNGKKIPLKYESEGIKKIVSVLQLLVVVYNKTSITVAIDELDSGIFEYLLGEILKIISLKGKGQLIFTSHNLRPLETLNKNSIGFTTTNSNNRYVRMREVKTNNNLRSCYYRNMVLGGQKEQLYDSTNNAEISLAFKEAGEILG